MLCAVAVNDVQSLPDELWFKAGVMQNTRIGVDVTPAHAANFHSLSFPANASVADRAGAVIQNADFFLARVVHRLP